MLWVIFLKFTFFRFKDFSKTFANSFDNCGLSSSGRALNKRNIGCVDSNVQSLDLFRIQIGCLFEVAF